MGRHTSGITSSGSKNECAATDEGRIGMNAKRRHLKQRKKKGWLFDSRRAVSMRVKVAENVIEAA